MATNEKFICSGCFNLVLKEEVSCPNCGFDGKNTNPTYALAIGNKLNENFVIGRVISENCESITYNAFNMLAKEKVIIKEFFPKSFAYRNVDKIQVMANPGLAAQYKSLLQDFEGVFSDLLKINGLSCLCDIEDVFYSGGSVYAVIKHYEDVTLEKIVGKDENKYPEGLNEFVEFLSSLKVMHEVNIIHRGIAPNRVVRLETGEFKLIEFATVSARTSECEYGTGVLDNYSAIEQFKPNGWQGKWTDVYGACATMYFYFTGIVPNSCMDRALDDSLLHLSLLNREVPKDVCDIIMKGLTLNPKERIQTIDELVELLSVHVKSEKVVIAKTDDTAKKPVKIKKRTKLQSLGIFALAFFITCLILGLVFVLVVPLVFEEEAVVNHLNDDSTVDMPEDGDYIPNFVGQNIGDIESDSNYNDYEFVVIEQFHNSIDIGVVISQDPDAESEIEEKVVTITVSKGPQLETMPNIINKDLASAETMLDALGILYDVYEVYDNSVPDGNVVRTDIDAGTEIAVASQRVQVFIAVNY